MLPVDPLVPPSEKVGSGKLWDDLGSTTFVTTKSDARNSRLSAKRRELARKIAESSDDELDFLSSGSRSDDVEDSIPSKSRHRSKKKQPGDSIVQRQESDCHPSYTPKRKPPNSIKSRNPVPGEESSSTSRSKASNASKKTPKQTKSYGIISRLHNNENERLSGQSSDECSLDDSAHPSTRRREIQKFPGLTLSPLRDGDQKSPHPDTPWSRTECTSTYGPSNPLYPYKTSSRKLDTNDPPTCRSRVRSSDSSDSSEATPRAKHSSRRLPEKIPFLVPLSVSDSTDQEQDEVKEKAPLEGATGRITEKTMPHKNHKSRYPVPSPLSSPVSQLSPTSAPAVRVTRSVSVLDTESDKGIDDESSNRRPQLRPFPMATNQMEPDCTPRRKTTFVQQTLLDNGRNDPLIIGDLEEVLDDSRQQHLIIWITGC
jgi:hypothetical protein